MKRIPLLDTEKTVIEDVLITLYNKIEKNNQTITRINKFARNKIKYGREESLEKDKFTIEMCEAEIIALRGAMNRIRTLITEKKLKL